MSYRPFPNQEYRNFFQTHLEIPTLLRAIPIPRGARILEIGCGRGVGLARFAQLCRPSRLAGVDTDAELVAIARARLKRLGTSAELRVCDARALTFDDDEFDVVVDFGTCYHIDHPARAFAEVHRVLRDGGVFIHETRVAQFLAHPVRSARTRSPFDFVPHLPIERSAILWAARRKVLLPAMTMRREEVYASATP